jgi:hypothetical protein
MISYYITNFILFYFFLKKKEKEKKKKPITKLIKQQRKRSYNIREYATCQKKIRRKQKTKAYLGGEMIYTGEICTFHIHKKKKKSTFHPSNAMYHFIILLLLQSLYDVVLPYIR